MSKTKKQNSLSTFLASKRGRQFFHVTYSVGAAIVILGALAKITHLPMGNVLLTIGMVVEAFVFFISAFDVDQVDYSEESAAVSGGVAVVGGSGVIGSSSGGSVVQGGTVSGGGSGKGGVVIAGGGGGVIGGGGFVGGGSGAGVAASSGVGSTAASSGGGVVVTGGGGFVGGGTVSGGVGNVGTGGSTSVNVGGASSTSSGIVGTIGTYDASKLSPEYIEQMDSAASGMAEFGSVMVSLNEMSQQLLDSCRQISSSTDDVSGFSANMKALNENVSNINSVYEAQFKSIADQINTIKYINESLDRIKSLYDNTVMDSNAFKMENERMTRQIQELNKVYARLLQAMNVGGGGYNQGGGYPGGGYNPGGYNNPESGGGYNPSL